MMFGMKMFEEMFKKKKRRARKKTSYEIKGKKRCAKGYNKKCTCVKRKGEPPKKKTKKKRGNGLGYYGPKNPGSDFLAMNQLFETRIAERRGRMTNSSSSTRAGVNHGIGIGIPG